MKIIKVFLVITGLLFGLSACSTVTPEVQLTYTSYPTYTQFPTYEPLPTYTLYPTYTLPPTIAIEVTRIVVVTPTYTPMPLYTLTVTNTPTNTFTPTMTPNSTQTAEANLYNKLHGDKGDGFYLINVDIAPGIWRSTGTNDDCYWSVTEANGDIIDNHFGMSGGTAYISPAGFQVEFNDCGTWVFLSPP